MFDFEEQAAFAISPSEWQVPGFGTRWFETLSWEGITPPRLVFDFEEQAAFAISPSDCPVIRKISDLSAFIGGTDPRKQRIIAAGDLNMSLENPGQPTAFKARERTIVNQLHAHRNTSDRMVRMQADLLRSLQDCARY